MDRLVSPDSAANEPGAATNEPEGSTNEPGWSAIEPDIRDRTRAGRMTQGCRLSLVVPSTWRSFRGIDPMPEAVAWPSRSRIADRPQRRLDSGVEIGYKAFNAVVRSDPGAVRVAIAEGPAFGVPAQGEGLQRR